MAHVTKFTGGAIGHMLQHYDRTKEIENIDTERSHLNYNLAADDQPLPQLDFIHQRLSEVRVQNRKDINKLCDWVVTAPKDLPIEEQPEFFRETYDFLRDKYGAKNVVSAYVHMDEVTPHIHFAFVPVVADPRRNGEKLSAKEAITKKDLQHFHEQLQVRIEERLGHPVSIQNEATREGNKSVEELKRQSATERLQKANEKASKIVSKAQKQVQTINDSLIAVKAEYEAKKAYVRQADNVADVSVMYPVEAKVTEKGLMHKQKFVTVPAEMWEAKHISANEKSYLQQANKELEKQIEAFKGTASAQNIVSLTRRVEELEEENRSLKYRNQALESNVSKAEREVDKTIAKINKVLSKLPDETAEQFVKEWKAPERHRSSGFDMER